VGCCRHPRRSQDKAEEFREKLIETVVEVDDEAMEAYLEGNDAGQ
jgi:elongation factor G